jgi:hypothetical protein
MLLKWIICDTDVDKKTSFSLAQEEWKTLKRVEGFIAQAGGWCASEEPKAGILAFWNSETDYRHFMKNMHDKIYDKSNQQKTYTNISVHLSESINRITNEELGSFLTLSERLCVTFSNGIKRNLGCGNHLKFRNVSSSYTLIISHEEIDNQNDSILMQLEPKWMVL